MSVHKVTKGKGGGWEVRWRQGTRHRSRTFRAKRDATMFDADLKRRRRLGTLADLDAGTELLADFTLEWWTRSAANRRLAPSTRKTYTAVWDTHVLGQLGDYQLRQITTGLIEDELMAPMARAGTGAPTQRKALLILQGVLRYAVRRERIPYNPAEQVERPRQYRKAVKPIAIDTVERALTSLEGRDRMLAELIAYQGLRPGEALALTDSSVRERTLLVEAGISLGAEKDTKTHRTRTVKLLDPVAQDLAAYRLATRRPSGCRLLFPRPDGRPWADHDWRNWRRRTWRPAIKTALGLGEDERAPRPYDLRHTYVSLLIAEGRSIAEVADQAGHSPEECARTYIHVFEEHQDNGGLSAEERILAARTKAQERSNTG